MADIVEKALAVSAVLRGDFSSCGRKVGLVSNPRDLYVYHVLDGCDDRDSEDEDYEERQQQDGPKSLYEDLLSAAAGCDVEQLRGGSGVRIEEVAAAKTMHVEVAGKRIPFNSDAFESIMPLGTPSAFGDILNQETRVDSEVRVATEFTEFRWLYADGSEVDPMALEEVERAVRAISTRIMDVEQVTLTKYKLNLYGKGGFFKKHTDHPHDAANTIGTLIVLLPTHFEGGELLVEDNNGAEHSLSNGAIREGDSSFRVCAFLTTAVHEVLAVTAGCRVTIAYSIELAPGYSVAAVAPGGILLTSPAKLIQQRLIEQYGSGATVGIISKGTYTAEAVASHGTACLVQTEDVEVCEFLQARLGVSVRLISVAYDFLSDIHGEFGCSDDNQYQATVYQISLRLWDNLFLGVVSKDDDDEDNDIIPERDVDFIIDPTECAGRELMKAEERAGFTGNSTEIGSLRCIYFHTALLFTVPSFTLKERKKRYFSEDDTPDAKRHKQA